MACEKSWAGPFREKALPILVRAEPEFAEFYDEGAGRPNRPVALVMGTLILKEANDLTDEEALDALRFDTRWWCAFELDPDEADLCQKTLHNFRAKLMASGKGKLAFRRITDELIAALGVRIDRQRLDSTHILSNFARLNRLGLFCETIRVFLHALYKGHRDLHDRLPAGLLKRHGEQSWYRDARREEGPRRLRVVARDLYRLVERFSGHRAISKMEEFKLLERLLSEQCTIGARAVKPRDDDDDRDDGDAPVDLKDPKEIGGNSLQTPHDPEVTYSGHKGQGYEALIAETCDPDNAVQLITHASLERSCEGDAERVAPTVEALAAREIAPEELLADTAFGSVENVAGCARQGVELIAPQPGSAGTEAAAPTLCVRDAEFTVQLVPSQPPSTCPCGVTALQTVLRDDPQDGPVALLQLPTACCVRCRRRSWCPALTVESGKTRREPLGRTTLALIALKANLPSRRRAAEQTEAFRERYAPRAGIEATNSELKRGQGLGDLRVRGA
ncbi:MAG: transposase, partial [Elusimicrobiota bacterium]